MKINKIDLKTPRDDAHFRYYTEFRDPANAEEAGTAAENGTEGRN